ncbi:MAG: hypothetical protein HZA80_02950 [Candidatus Taylorbacteria bacterium]|nr:hypothetical protein [Candidatus Taylorbacteria bacterium]
MEYIFIIALLLIIVWQTSKIKKINDEIKRLWQYSVYMENILRKNNLWKDEDKDKS